MRKSVKHKLQSYSAAALATVSAGVVQGAIRYTDVNPNVVLDFDGESYNINMDNSGLSEFQFQFNTSGGTISNSYLFGTYVFSMGAIFGFSSSDEFVVDNVNNFGWNAPAVERINAGENIGPTRPWGSNPGAQYNLGYYFSFNSLIGTNSSTKDEGYWRGQTGYVGVRFQIGTDIHYGWIGLSVNSNYQVTILDYAYEDIPATSIIAGRTCSTAAPTTNGDSRCDPGSVTLTATPGSGGTDCNWYTSSSGGTAFFTGTSYTTTINSTQTYYVATASSICESPIRTPVVAELVPPNISAGSDQTICTGDNTTLSASGGVSYTWDNGLGSGATHTVSPTTTTTYQVTGTDANGCTATDAITITVGSYPTADAGADQTICEGDAVTISASGGTSYSWNNALGAGATHSVSPNTTTTYQVTVANAAGCTDTDNVTIFVNESPNISTTNDTILCEGDSLPIWVSGSGNYTYNWNQGLGSDSSYIVSPTTATLYTVTALAANGCDATSSISVNIGATPTPSIYTSGEFQLLSSYSNGNQWFLNGDPIPGATNNYVFLEDFGYYTVQVTNSAGCTGESDPFYFEDTTATSVNGLVKHNAIIFPNPATNHFMITSEVYGPARVQIFDPQGRLVKAENVTIKENATLISIADLEAGIYYVELRINETTQLRKLVIE